MKKLTMFDPLENVLYAKGADGQNIHSELTRHSDMPQRFEEQEEAQANIPVEQIAQAAGAMGNAIENKAQAPEIPESTEQQPVEQAEMTESPYQEASERFGNADGVEFMPDPLNSREQRRADRKEEWANMSRGEKGAAIGNIASQAALAFGDIFKSYHTGERIDGGQQTYNDMSNRWKEIGAGAHIKANNLIGEDGEGVNPRYMGTEAYENLRKNWGDKFARKRQANLDQENKEHRAEQIRLQKAALEDSKAREAANTEREALQEERQTLQNIVKNAEAFGIPPLMALERSGNPNVERNYRLLMGIPENANLNLDEIRKEENKMFNLNLSQSKLNQIQIKNAITEQENKTKDLLRSAKIQPISNMLTGYKDTPILTMYGGSVGGVGGRLNEFLAPFLMQLSDSGNEDAKRILSHLDSPAQEDIIALENMHNDYKNYLNELATGGNNSAAQLLNNINAQKK